MKKIEEIREMRKAVEDVVWQLADKKEREDVLVQLTRYVEMMDQIQTLPMVPRLRYYRAVTAVYDCLRRNGQLARHEGGIDAPVRDAINHELLILLGKNGLTED